MRRQLSLLAVPVLVLGLAACTGSGAANPSASATPSAGAASCSAPKSGDLSDAVTVTGDLGAKPTATFKAPLDPTSSQRTTVIEGSGPKAKQGDVVNVSLAVYDATTGKEQQSAGYDGQKPTQLTVSTDYYVKGIVDALCGAAEGSRTVTVATAADMTTSTNATSGTVVPVVIVADIVSIVPQRATGVDQPAQDGFPTVKLADDGQPTVTVPKTDPPADLKIEVLKKGDGEVVPDPANVTVQYQGVNWRTGKVFDQSWGKGQLTPFSTDQVVSGFAKAMIGQTVGSQVVVIIPPSEGYGEAGQPSAGIEGTDTLVFVIDILAIG
ncbi:FKBP-type peptidyl-prolyl cis-trans isomerase [Frigoribacterium sp. 2-23]|uniref:FKBP-type peptidyl-prolyl cis-trans isomerase n=1 Tax=Frigoribacterium sp. 2-23 TaxID=3415006 RepID=UPI003C6EA7EA